MEQMSTMLVTGLYENTGSNMFFWGSMFSSGSLSLHMDITISSPISFYTSDKSNLKTVNKLYNTKEGPSVLQTPIKDLIRRISEQ